MILKSAVNEETVDKIKAMIKNKSNGFISCYSPEEFEILNECFPKSLKEPFEKPFVIQIGKGKVQNLIPKEETEDLPLYTIDDIAYNYLLDKKAWRLCGAFIKHYDWTAKNWCEYWSKGEPTSSNPFEKCWCCGKTFEDNEILYQGAVKQKEGFVGFKTFCKACAYENAEKIIDYTLDDKGEPIIKECKGDLL